MTRATTPGGSDWREHIDWILREVAELPDRTSPEDFPELMMVTADELRAILIRATGDAS